MTGVGSSISQGTERPFHPKRPHRKSRTGCTNCKARKVKCDEARPACRNCVLRRAECVYQNGPGLVSREKRRSPSLHSGSTSEYTSPDGSEMGEVDDLTIEVIKRHGIPRYTEVSPTHPSFEEIDMKLLWWYTNFAHYSVAIQAGISPVVDDILKIKIPQHAFRTPFLMDTILALSASHLETLKKGISNERALHYRSRAFNGYRRAIEEADPETFPALLAGSLITAVLASQMFREDNTRELFIIEWMVVWRGIGLIITMVSKKALWESGMYPLFYRAPLDLDTSENAIPEYLFSLVSSLDENDPDYKNAATYYNALKYLGSLYLELRNGPSAILNLRVLTWFTFIPEPFTVLARMKKPRALIIIAHYLIFVRVIQKVWWLQGISEREIPAIDRFLGREWRHFMRIPCRSLEIDDPIELIRLTLDDPAYMLDRDGDLYGEVMDPRVKSLCWVDNSGRPIPPDGKVEDVKRSRDLCDPDPDEFPSPPPSPKGA